MNCAVIAVKQLNSAGKNPHVDKNFPHYEYLAHLFS